MMKEPAPSATQRWTGCDLERRVQALGADAAAARWISARVDTYLTAMLRRFKLSQARAQHRFPLELLTAQARCAACSEVGRCRRFLAEGGEKRERPAAFCPNAPLFRRLRRQLSGDGLPASRRGP